MMNRDPQSIDWALAAPNADTALQARHRFVDHLRVSAGRHADLDAAQMIFAELVGNVVRHAPGPIWIGLHWTRDRKARLCVRDSGVGFAPAFALPQDQYAESGRGLAIVATLADTVTVSRDAAGTLVCATLPVSMAT